MGRKRARKRQYLHFFAAVLIFLLSGCSVLKEMRDQNDSRDALERGQRLLAQGNYEDAVKENQRVLSVFENKAPADEALFNLALIHSHVENPQKDYRKAMNLFSKLVKDYPQSPFAEQSKVWIGVLQVHDKLSQENEKLTQANQKLTELIERSKQVDLEIEEKKRKK